MNKIANLKPIFPLLILAGVIFLIPASAIATFSIVAVDNTTGAVGSAGASCIAGSQMINDVVEGIGAVNTQAYYLSQNQGHAHSLLVSGLTPDSIIGWLINNDAEGDPEIRQYGVVTLAGPGASAAFTGYMTTNYKGHLTGFEYSIQGNILLNAHVLDTMQFAFLNTPGPLEEKLMAVLEAANIPGADSRCTSCGKPAISAFIHVVHPCDGGTPFLYEVVNNTTCPVNPIDSLVWKFNNWKQLQIADPALSTISASPDIIPASGHDTAMISIAPLNYAGQPVTHGAIIELSHTGAGSLMEVIDMGDGTYGSGIISPPSFGTDTITATVIAGGQTVVLNQKAIVTYYLCGDPNADTRYNALDVTYLINFLYKHGTAPKPAQGAGDANGSGVINALDITYLINFLYKHGAPPICP